MSIIAISAVFDAIAPLSMAELMILLVLANYADDDGGSCFPSQESIWEKSRFKSRRGVQKILDRLEDRGLVSVLDRGRQNRSTRYRLELAALSRGERRSPLKPFRGERRSPLEASSSIPRGERRNAPEANQETFQGERRSPDPSVPVTDPSVQPAPPVCSTGNEPIPEARYRAIAKTARERAVKDGRPTYGTITEYFKQEAGRLGVAYDADAAQQAIAADLLAWTRAEAPRDSGSGSGSGWKRL